MLTKIDWEKQIGRRLKLRDLHVFSTVVQRANMAKAAAELGVSQPTISEVISDLEHALGVRLFDRSRRGVEPTIYGTALVRRVQAAFDELRQGVRDIEFLADSATGEVRIGCPESLATTLVSPIVRRFTREYPRVAINTILLNTPTLDLPQLHDRTLDLVVARSPVPATDDPAYRDLQMECLFDDSLVIAAGAHSRFKHRTKVDLADLINEPWILTPPGAAIHHHMMQVFRQRGLTPPFVAFSTQSFGFRSDLLETGDYIAPIPRSIFHEYAKRFPLKLLQVDLPVRPWPVALITLKNRTVSPVVERFIDIAQTLAGRFRDGLRSSDAETRVRPQNPEMEDTCVLKVQRTMSRPTT
jgi:DNA-binding transcriptional LysR family regulator